MERLETPWRPVEIEQRLEARLGFRAVLVISEAAVPATVLPSGGLVHVRVPSVLLHAPGEVLDALVRFVRAPGDLEARALLAEFANASPVRDAGREDETAGRFHDLGAIFTDVNARFFAGRVVARIAWSRGSTERRRHSILFGSYLRPPGETAGQIKIHPALDQEWVPRGFVEFVVHHECLHAVIPTRCIGGRRAFHPPEFRVREKRYPDFRQWRRWEKENLGRFLGKELASR
jgi:hypothetical protein